MNENKKQNYVNLVLVLLVVFTVVFVRGVNMNSNQEASSIDSQLSGDISRIDPTGGYTKKCPVPALTLTPDTNPNSTTILRGQQQYQVFIVKATTGRCDVKINSLALQELGTAGASTIERLEYHVDYDGSGSNRFVAPIIANGTMFAYNTTAINNIIPANAGQPNSGVPAVKFRFLVSVSPDVPINLPIPKTIQLQIFNGFSLGAVDVNGNNVVVGGNFPINSSIYDIPNIAQAPGGITNTSTNNITQTSAKLKAVVSGNTFGTTNSYTGFVINPVSNDILLNPTSIVPTTGITLNAGLNNISHIVSGLNPSTAYKYRSCVRYGITPTTNMWNDNQVCGPVKNVTTL